jgi:FkbM family methyltransferase
MIKRIIRNGLATLTKELVRLCLKKGCLHQDDIVENLSSYIDVKTKYGKITFFCPGQLPIWRANTFFDLEPETLEWIDSFEKEGTFFDIGANVGLYSLYAGIKGHQVISFEPYSANQYILNKNIYINNLDSKVMAISAALSDKFQFSKFYMQNMKFGAAENSAGSPIDWQEKDYDSKFNQGIMEYSLDVLLNIPNMPFPNYIKIDVDGIEDKILKGAQKTLQDKRLKEVLVELDEKHSTYRNVLEFMQSSGFDLEFKKQGEVFSAGIYKDMYNHLFVRKKTNS